MSWIRIQPRLSQKGIQRTCRITKRELNYSYSAHLSRHPPSLPLPLALRIASFNYAANTSIADVSIHPYYNIRALLHSLTYKRCSSPARICIKARELSRARVLWAPRAMRRRCRCCCGRTREIIIAPRARASVAITALYTRALVITRAR